MERVLLMTLAVCACTKSSAPKVTAIRAEAPVAWPRFPSSPAEAAQLVKAQTKVSGEPLDLRPERAWETAEKSGWQKLIAGEHRVDDWIRAQQASWVLVGTFHDSPEQVRVFRGLIAPGGAGPFGSIALEQLRAPGAWVGETDGGTADSQALEAYWRSGSAADFEALREAHRRHDYTAWKYGYDDEVLQAIVAARAQNLPVSGCDVPDGLMARLRDDDDSMRVRELHCRLTLGEAKGPVAMLWGQAHVGPDGFRRFLEPGVRALSLVLLGGRHSADAPDSEYRDRLVLNDQVLIPAAKGYAWLWIPDRFTGGEVDRTRVGADPVAASVVASADEPGTLSIGEVTLELRDEERSKPLPAGEYTYAFRTKKGLNVVGSVEVPESGTAVLHFEPSARTTRVTIAGPKYR